LFTFLQMKHLSKICLDNKRMICQDNPYQGVISNKEWEVLPTNHQLEHLFLNSDNLTNDVIDYILSNCLGLKKFFMNTLVLKRLKENLVEGSDVATVVFQSTDNPRLGFKARRDFKIKKLLKNEHEEPFSDSMIQVMENLRNDEVKTEQELLEEELEREVESEFREKFGDQWVDEIRESVTTLF